MYLIKYHTMKTYGGVEVQLHAFLTLALDGGEWLASCPSSSILGKSPGIHLTESWVGPRNRMDTMAKRKKLFIAPARNQTPVVQPVAYSCDNGKR
jgi:hypothetical protein